MHDKESIATKANPSASDLHKLHPPRKPPAPPKPAPPPDPDIENAKAAAEMQQEALVAQALTDHQAGHKKFKTSSPPDHPCNCQSIRGTCIFLMMVQGVIVPIALIVIAVVAVPMPDPADSTSEHEQLSYWWPYLLTIPAFLDLMCVALIVWRERGPGGSLEFQLFPCCIVPSSRSR